MNDLELFQAEMLERFEVTETDEVRTVERELARAMIRLRLSKGITQKELAARMCMPQGNVSRLESGTSSPTLATLQRAAKALDVPFEIRIGNQIISINK